MPVAEDFKDDPPSLDENGLTLSRCVMHPDSHGLNYKDHLRQEHLNVPEVEAWTYALSLVIKGIDHYHHLVIQLVMIGN